MTKQIYPRTFLAIIPPENICKKLLKEIQPLKTSLNLAEVKWYVPEKLHITLQFLGKITLEQVFDLSHQLTEAMQNQAPFAIALGDVVVFPSLWHAKVIATEVIESPELLSLAATIDEVTKACDLREPDFPFNGHLTLGRLPHKLLHFESNKLADALPHVEWLVDTIYLMESVMEHGHSIYVKLAEFKLNAD